MLENEERLAVPEVSYIETEFLFPFIKPGFGMLFKP